MDTFEEPDADNAFDSGKVAFLRSWDSSYANAMSSESAIADPAKVGVMPLPASRGQRRAGWSVIGGWDIFVNPRTRNLRADLTFASWMAGIQAQRILATQYSQIPSVTSVRADPAVIRADPVLQAAANAQLVSRPSETPGYQKVTEAIHTHIHAALPGQSSEGHHDPCLELIGAAHAIDPHVHGTLRCARPAASHG